MITRTEKVRLGIFLMVSTSVLVITFIILAGVRMMKSLDTYYVHFEESVSGLELGAQVKYNGVRVGQVVDIRIDPKHLDNVIVRLDLRRGTPIRSDARAILTGMGITGLKFVEITGGSASATLLKPGGIIKSGRSFMGTIEGKAEDIAVKVELAVSRINAVLSEENVARIDDVIANIREITDRVNNFLGENDEKLDAIVDDFTETSKDLKEGMASANRSLQDLESIIQTSKPDVAVIIENVRETSVSFRKTASDLAKVDDILQSLSSTLRDFNSKLKSVDVEGISDGMKKSVDEAGEALTSIRRIVDASRNNIYDSSKALKRTLRNLEDFSAEIRNQPGLLLSNEKPENRTPPED